MIYRKDKIPEDLQQFFIRAEIGLEESPTEYVNQMVDVFREVRRVLRPDGTLWVNLGDSYAANRTFQVPSTNAGAKHSVSQAAGGYGMRVPDGLKAKDLVGIPWRMAFALQADGWYLRAAIPWVKPNCMPTSQQDRPTVGTEYVFLLAHPDSGGRYFYDIESTRVPPNTKPQRRFTERKDHAKGAAPPPGASLRPPNYATSDVPTVACTPLSGRNRRDTDWFMDSLQLLLDGEGGLLSSPEGDPIAFKINPKPYNGAHFAVWPPALVEPMVRAGTSAHGVCRSCGSPWKRAVEREDLDHDGSWFAQRHIEMSGGLLSGGTAKSTLGTKQVRELLSAKWEPSCDCVEPGPPVPATVLDPFSGSATTGMVALSEGRSYIGCDINPEFLDLAVARVEDRKAPAKQTEAVDDVIDFMGDM